MTACRRFEEEALLRLEKGLPLDEHFASCPDCLSARDAYERLGEEISAAGTGLDPHVAWQADVWAALDARRRSRPRGRSWWLLAPVAAAAGLAAVVLFLRPPPPAALIALDVAVIGGEGPARRGTEAHTGDRLHLRAATGGAAHAELRVYRGERVLLLRCSTEPPCRRRGPVLEADVELPSIGSYQPLLLTSERPLPEPGAGLDSDVDAVLTAGGEATLGTEVEVR